MRAEDILPLLQKVRKSRRGWIACCPAHSDRRPSLSIGNGDRGLMLHCFTGCPVDQVRAALGLQNTPYQPYRPTPRYRPVAEPQIDFTAMFAKWNQETDYHFRDGFAMTLGVDPENLRSLGFVWTGKTWAIPMHDANQKIIGMRLRDMNGNQWAVRGSKAGLFLPRGLDVLDDTLFICEGATDTAAALTLGLRAVGRPSCIGQEDLINAYVTRNKIRQVVIIADQDGPGLNGARKLQHALTTRSCIVVLPTKDIRDFVVAGGDADMIADIVKDTVWKAA